jgi:hypothetical protein
MFPVVSSDPIHQQQAILFRGMGQPNHGNLPRFTSTVSVEARAYEYEV